MNPHLCRIVLRPRDPFEVFDLAVRFAREQWRPLARLLALTVLPPMLLVFPLCWLLEGSWLVLILPVLLAPALSAVATVLAGRLLFSDDVSVLGVVWAVLKLTPVLWGIWCVGVFGWLVSSLTCFVGTPFLQAWLLYLNETALLEKVGLQGSVRRSLRLSGAHLGIAFAGVVGWWVLTVWFALLGELGGQMIVAWVLQLGEPFGSLQGGLVTPWLVFGLLVAQPAHAVYRLLLYVDVRTRVEGWDLQVALRAAGMEAER